MNDTNPVNLSFLKARSRSWLPCVSAICAFSALAGVAQAEIAVGENGAIAFGMEATVEHNSNIRLNSDEESDVIGVAEPRLLYRHLGDLLMNAHVGMEFREYDQASEFDSENFKSGITLDYPAGDEDRNFRLRFDAGFNESTSADSALQAIVERETLHGDLDGWYYFNERYFTHAAVYFRDQDTVSGNYEDVQTVTVPVDFFYRYTEDLSFGVGYRYRDTTVDGTNGLAAEADSSDHAIYFAVEGRISPSVDGEIRVGAQRRNFDDGAFDDDDSVFFETLLTWTISEQTSLLFRAGDEYDTSAANESIDRLYGELELHHRFNDKIIAAASVGYAESDFTRPNGDEFRSDDEWFVSIGVDYELIKDRLALSGTLYHADQSSNLSNSDYEHSVAQLGLSLVY